MCKSTKSVTWEAESLMGTTPPTWSQRMCPRAALSHVGLLVALMLYTVGGGFVSIRFIFIYIAHLLLLI